ncbi:hypothetical protein TWF730_010195 [Orbilia blumenaviensis]|uniref:Uncharacterized protein n=1 Tax=Orbilia blumenaviensis TaxID=1796055 RepID=A0AAV9UML8_9PEZI
MDCRRDPTTGEPIGSIVYAKPSKAPEWLILNLLPLGAIGFGNVAKAVAMVRRIMEEEGHEMHEAVVRGVKLMGVTDPKIIEGIRSQGTRGGKKEGRKEVGCEGGKTGDGGKDGKKGGVLGLEKAELGAGAAGGAYVPPHLRYGLPGQSKTRAPEGGEKGGRREEKDGGNKKGVLGLDKAEPVTRAVGGAYVPPHLRYGLPGRFQARAPEGEKKSAGEGNGGKKDGVSDLDKVGTLAAGDAGVPYVAPHRRYKLPA